MSNRELDRLRSLGAPSLRPPLSPEDHDQQLESSSPDDPSKGINLTLVYSLIALALVAAIGFALLIVLPFYHRR